MNNLLNKEMNEQLVEAITKNDTKLLTKAIMHYAPDDKERSGGIDFDLIAEALVLCCKLGHRNESLDHIIKLSYLEGSIYRGTIEELVRAIKKYDK